ncbi:DUF2783 domain-containing protein [Niveispirillum sp. SYP-B3756]|nr:DUF2783 domain-containing protein [Niveispirillum sp. SYP-B3756]
MHITPNIPDPDAFYAALLDTHRGLSATESQALNARLVLLLANQIGDQAVLMSCLQTARNTGATHRRNDP